MSATTTALVRPVRAVAWELRTASASGRRVALSIGRGEHAGIEGHVLRVAATDAYVQVAGLHVPLDDMLAVHQPSRRGDSTAREAFYGTPRRVVPQDEQLW